MAAITVTHTFIDSETGETSDQPLPTHVERIAAAIAKNLREAPAPKDEQSQLAACARAAGGRDRRDGGV